MTERSAKAIGATSQALKKGACNILQVHIPIIHEKSVESYPHTADDPDPLSQSPSTKWKGYYKLNSSRVMEIHVIGLQENTTKRRKPMGRFHKRLQATQNRKIVQTHDYILAGPANN